MPFHLGKPILVMLAIALVSGLILLVGHKPTARAELTLWTFTYIHADTYRSIRDDFERATGNTLDVQLISSRAENVRLESMFMSGRKGNGLPDVVEVEINQVGKFFRPPLDQIGFLPLNDYLKRGDWEKRLVSARLATWSKQGVVFGVPHDVHPTGIMYRKDLFDEAGVDLASARTWPQFQEMCLQFQGYWHAHGRPTRHAMELSRNIPDAVVAMLLQRGVNIVDENDHININDRRVAQTMAFYVQLVVGPRAIGSDAAAGTSSTGLTANDAVQGNLCAFIMPDWRVAQFKTFASSLTGNMRLMPLPIFESGDKPTTTWGGTMIGITRNCPRPDDAWKLIEFLCLSQTGLEARQKYSNILPPVIEWWDQPVYHRADPYFGGQRVDELYVELARQLPKRFISPVTVIAQSELGVVLNRAMTYAEEHGTDGLEAYCQHWLDFSYDDLQARVKHDLFADQK
jgi:arabinosaccharide transport system substrate-binding protein